MNKQTYPELKWIYKVIIINDFLINTVSGLVINLFMVFSSIITLNNLYQYFTLGVVFFLPFYILHLFSSIFKIKKLYINKDILESFDLKKLTFLSEKLIKYPKKVANQVSALWLVSTLYSVFYVSKYLNYSVYTTVFVLFSILGIIPFVWVVEYIIIRRCTVRLLKNYMQILPEELFLGKDLSKSSILKKWTAGLIHIALYSVFLMALLNFGLFRNIMEKQLHDFTEIQLNQIESDIGMLLETNLTKQEMNNYLKSIHIVGNGEISVISNKTGDVIGAELKQKSVTEDIIITRDLPEKGYKIEVFIPGDYLKFYNNFMKKSVLLFCILFFSIGIVVVIQLGKDFRSRIKMITDLTSRIADGNLNKGNILFSNDEIGDIYKQILFIKNNIKDIVSKISNYSRKITNIMLVIQDISDFLLKIAAHQDQMVNEARESVIFIDDFTEKIKKSSEELADEAEGASSTVIEFAASINQIKNSMHKLLRISEAESSSINEMNASIREITGNLGNLKDFSSMIEDSLDKITEFSRSSGFLLSDLSTLNNSLTLKSKDTQDAMKKVHKSVNNLGELYETFEASMDTNLSGISEIESILQIIDDFLDQTNILALNAAIIAAQTDTKDKGFGVIADEIKELSEQISTSTSKITHIVDNTVSNMKEQAERYTGARDSFKSISKNIHLNIDNIEDISSTLEKSTEKITKINDLLKEHHAYSQNLQENSRMSHSQLTSIFNALDEQKKNSSTISDLSIELKEMAELVTSAARQQTAGANIIANSSEKIKDFSLDSKSSIEKLKDSLNSVVFLASELNTNTLLSNSRAKELKGIVSTISSELKLLQEEVGKFNLPSKR